MKRKLLVMLTVLAMGVGGCALPVQYAPEGENIAGEVHDVTPGSEKQEQTNAGTEESDADPSQQAKEE